MERFMRESDAFTWYLESDPVLRSTVVVAQMFDRSPDWEMLNARMARVVRLVPELHERPVDAPARLAPPRWTGDPEFDLAWHMRRMAAPPPHGEDVVLDVARKEASTAFDLERPLWQFTLIEGLEGGRGALIMKMHHSITDGLGAMQLAFTLFDHHPGPVALGPLPEPPDDGTPSPAGVWGGYMSYRARRALATGIRLSRLAVPTAFHSARRPLGSLRSTAAVTASIGRTVQPLFDTKSPIMKKRGLGRQLAFLECGLDELRAAGKVAGGTVNDGFVAAAAGGLRLYHERHGRRLRTLRMMMPISLRADDDPAGGNRITLMRFEVPAGEKDPARRIQRIRAVSGAARTERSLPYTNSIAGVLNLLPSPALGSIFKHVDFLASDVPTFTEPVYLAGARLLREVVFGPTTGTAINLTLTSYAGHCTIGMTIDTSAVPDADVLVEAMRRGLEEVLAIGRQPTPPATPTVTPPRDASAPVGAGGPTGSDGGRPGSLSGRAGEQTPKGARQRGLS